MKEQPAEKKKHSSPSSISSLFGFSVLIVAVACCTYLYLNSSNKAEDSEPIDGRESEDDQGLPLFSAKELEKFDGTKDSRLYLAILGLVFDVTRGAKHYGPGEAYHAFVAKDISRAFVTGEFESKSIKDSLDHVLSMSPSELLALKKWKDFYLENYDLKGKMIGRFYDKTGEPTEYYWQIDRKIQFGVKQQQEETQFNSEFPSCNVEYKADTGGTRFWCTNQSGGVSRDWAGYPIQLFNQDTKTSVRCICTKKENFDLPQLKQYENCDESTRSCVVIHEDLGGDD